MSILAIKKDVGRAIVWLRRCSHLESGWYAHDEVASACLQRIAKETSSLRPPGVLDALAEILGQQVRDLVFETLTAFIGKRKIVWIGTDAQHTGRTSKLRSGCN